MKKVSILSLHLGYGGIEKCVCALANILVKKYDVEIVCTYKLYDKPIYKLDKKVKVKYLTNVKPNKEEFKKYLKQVKLISAFKEGIKSIKILNLRKNTMINYIKSSDSDIIISTRDIFNSLLSKYKKDNTLTIAWEHNHYNGNIKYANKIIESVKNLDYLVVVSNDLKQYYKDKVKAKVVNIPNIIDNIPEKLSTLKEKKLISVGRLSKEKGFIDLLSIFNDLHKKYPDYTLDIIGDGNEKESLEKYINDNNLNNYVKLHGFRNKEYIDKLLDSSSVYLMTSYTESFGIVLIEAMSHGIPCIAYSSAEGANEIIENEKNGYLIENRDKEKYIEKIELLINDYNLRKTLGEYAYKSIDKYKEENVEKLWFDIMR